MSWFSRSPRPPRRAHFSYRKKLRLESLENRSLLTLLGAQLFPADNPWNQRIADAPVAANSAAIINNIVTRSGDGRLHPDFGEDSNSTGDLYGIPYNVVHGNSVAKISVIIDAYDNESDIVPAPIPANPVLEGDYQNGPKAGVDNRGDSHLIVFDVDNNIVYEYYRASRPSENSDGRWHADQQTVWDLKTNTFRTLGYTSADAAGLPILTGLARPDEGLPVSQGGQGVINHAIRMTLQNSIILDQFQYPASHTANPGNNNTAIQPPMGARFRLKAGVDISQLNPQSRIIAQAMKDYGMIVADNGSNFYFTGASHAVDANNQETLTWDDDDIQNSTRGLKSLRFSDFEVVDLTPIVTGLSATSGAAGTTVTVTGKNFSGAAGNLKVLFGNTSATSVTVLDDTRVTAVVPAGSGAVDVRVQSGATTGANPDNYESPIFGYGISAVTSAARFTYSAVTNQSPTVATAASASPSTVTGTTTNLSVLGADDGGEVNLRYTWSSTGPAAVTYSANGTNAAKNSTATFTQPGNYTFTVTIADAAGLTTTSTVIVTVQAPNQAPTMATPASASLFTFTGKTTALKVKGADDGGESNLQYTWTSTGPAAVSFSANSTNAAKNTTATFSKAGNYTFTATIRDAAGLTVTSSTSFVVKQIVTLIIVSPGTATVGPKQQVQFTAASFDQFGAAFVTAPNLNWSVSGRGSSINDDGLFTASRRTGMYTIRASAGSVNGTATVSVVGSPLTQNLLRITPLSDLG
jgi:plastocyanin